MYLLTTLGHVLLGGEGLDATLLNPSIAIINLWYASCGKEIYTTRSLVPLGLLLLYAYGNWACHSLRSILPIIRIPYQIWFPLTSLPSYLLQTSAETDLLIKYAAREQFLKLAVNDSPIHALIHIYLSILSMVFRIFLDMYATFFAFVDLSMYDCDRPGNQLVPYSI